MNSLLNKTDCSIRFISYVLRDMSSNVIHWPNLTQSESNHRNYRAWIQINVDQCGFPGIHIASINRRSRHASLLRVAFGDAMLTQCNFYYVLTRDAIRVRSFHIHMRAYALIVVVKFYSTYVAIYAVYNFCANPDWSGFWEFALIWIRALVRIVNFIMKYAHTKLRNLRIRNNYAREK